MSGVEDEKIEQELESKKKIGHMIQTGITSRLKHIITEWDGETDVNKIGLNVENMLARDSMALRNEITRISPDIEMKTPVEFDEGGTVDVDIPLTVNFFWPESE